MVQQLLMPLLIWAWLLAWPLKPEWLPVALQANISFEADLFCPSHVACYHSGVKGIFISPKSPEWTSLKELYAHEMQHHFQFKTLIWERLGGWSKFESILEDLIRSGRYGNKHQLSTMKAMLRTWEPLEAHAELPAVLKYEIPPELADWYPWFYCGGEDVR